MKNKVGITSKYNVLNEISIDKPSIWHQPWLKSYISSTGCERVQALTWQLLMLYIDGKDVIFLNICYKFDTFNWATKNIGEY